MQQGLRHHISQRKEYFQKNLQENKPIFNQIRKIQEIGNKLTSLPTKHPTPDHIEDVVKSTIIPDWYASIFSNDKKWQNTPHSVHHFYVLR